MKLAELLTAKVHVNDNKQLRSVKTALTTFTCLSSSDDPPP